MSSRRQARCEKGLTVAMAAEMIGVSQMTIYRFEQGSNVRVSEDADAYMAALYGDSFAERTESRLAVQRLFRRLVETRGQECVCVSDDKPWLFQAALDLAADGRAIVIHDATYEIQRGPRAKSGPRRVRKISLALPVEVTPEPPVDELQEKLRTWAITHDPDSTTLLDRVNLYKWRRTKSQ